MTDKLLRDGAPAFDFDAIADKRRRMIANGYQPLAIHSPWSLAKTKDGAPIAGKVPALRSDGGPWTKGHDDKRLFRISPVTASTGALAGDVVGFDVDVPDRCLSKETLRIAHQNDLPLGDAPMRGRSDGSGKVLFMFRAAETMKKMQVSCKLGKVELLARGQHFVVDGFHANSVEGTLIRYQWRSQAGDPWTRPAAELPTVRTSQIFHVLSAILNSGVIGPLDAADAQGAPPHRRSERLSSLREQHGGNLVEAVKALMAETGEGSRHDNILSCVGALAAFGGPFTRSIMEPLVERLGPEWRNELDGMVGYCAGKDDDANAKWAAIKGSLGANDVAGALKAFDEHASGDPRWRARRGRSLVFSLARRGEDDPEALALYARWALDTDDVDALVADALKEE
jgi:hypothetical protein